MGKFTRTLFVVLVIMGCNKSTGPSEEEPESFNITLMGVEALPIKGWQRVAIEQAVKRWEQVITEGFPDARDVPDVGDLDDVLIEFKYSPHRAVNRDNQHEMVLAGARPTRYREVNRGAVPFRGEITLYPALVETSALTNEEWESIIIHEIAHVLGFSDNPDPLGGFKGLRMMTQMNNKKYFTGPLAAEAYREILFQRESKNMSPDMLVPLDNDGTHWDGEALKWDIMTPRHIRGAVLSAVTIQAMADIGYTVDVSKAEKPSSFLTKPAVGKQYICDGQHIRVAVNP